MFLEMKWVESKRKLRFRCDRVNLHSFRRMKSSLQVKLNAHVWSQWIRSLCKHKCFSFCWRNAERSIRTFIGLFRARARQIRTAQKNYTKLEILEHIFLCLSSISSIPNDNIWFQVPANEKQIQILWNYTQQTGRQRAQNKKANCVWCECSRSAETKTKSIRFQYMWRWFCSTRIDIFCVGHALNSSSIFHCVMWRRDRQLSRNDFSLIVASMRSWPACCGAFLIGFFSVFV